MSAQYCTEVSAELPGWVDDEPFRVKLRRPSVLMMAADGVIPNELLAAAQKLFCEGYDTGLPLDRLGRLLNTVAGAALVEPTMDELKAQGIQLTDVQLAAIYSFVQTGVRALEPFRNGSGGNISDGNDKTVRRKTEQAAEHR